MLPGREYHPAPSKLHRVASASSPKPSALQQNSQTHKAALSVHFQIPPTTQNKLKMFFRESILPMQNKYGTHFKMLKALSLNTVNYHIPLLFCFSLYFLCKMKQRHSYRNGIISTFIKLNNRKLLDSKTIEANI